MKSNLAIIIIILLFNFNIYIKSSITEFSRSVFYRTSTLSSGNRFSQKNLNSLDIAIFGGITKHGYNKKHKDECLYNIYNYKYHIQNNILDIIRFSYIESDINIYRNFSDNIFLHFHIPALKTDITLESKKNRMVYFIESKQHGTGDSSLFAGYTYTYDNTNILDYIDLTIEAGVLFPTGKGGDSLLNIPYGYNKRWGIPIILDGSLGIFDWLDFGLHFDSVYLFKNNNYSNSGVIRGTTYIEADHFCAGLSLVLGISYEQEYKTKIINKNLRTLINKELNKSWNRGIFNLLLNYDFAENKDNLNFSLGFLTNLTITGKRVFNTPSIGTAIDFNLIY